MPPVHRLGDVGTGHGCYPSRPNCEGSPTVFANGIPVHRLDDGWESHCWGPPCHGGFASGGSGTVSANGKALCRIGDPVDCGSDMATGSPNVFAG